MISQQVFSDVPSGAQTTREITFNKPSIGGERLDWCRTFRTNCGAPAAEVFCQINGYSKLLNSAIDPSPKKTNVIGDGKTCIEKQNNPFCDGFKFITCSTKPGDTIPNYANPAPGYPITSEYGPRSRPCKGCGTPHKGIDIGTPEGTPIAAAAKGKVIFSGVSRGYGNTVIIDHGGGRQTLYGHLKSTSVTTGSNVTQGQNIGISDTTGNVSGPHLHFETFGGAKPGQRFTGIRLDPRNFVQF